MHHIEHKVVSFLFGGFSSLHFSCQPQCQVFFPHNICINLSLSLILPRWKGLNFNLSSTLPHFNQNSSISKSPTKILHLLYVFHYFAKNQLNVNEIMEKISHFKKGKRKVWSLIVNERILLEGRNWYSKKNLSYC